MNLSIIHVIWADAHSNSAGWTGRRDIDDEEEYLVHSVGWLLTEEDGGKPNHVTICQSHTTDEDVDHVLFIPQGMVRKVEVLSQKPTAELRYPHGRQET